MTVAKPLRELPSILQWNSLVPLLHISYFYWAYLFNSETKCVPHKPLPLFVRAGSIMCTKQTCLLIVSHVLKLHKQPRYEVTGRIALIFSETLPHQSPMLSKSRPRGCVLLIVPVQDLWSQINTIREHRCENVRALDPQAHYEVSDWLPTA